VSSSLDDMTPYMFIRMSRPQPENLVIDVAKRLLQQYRPAADSCTATNSGRINRIISTHTSTRSMFRFIVTKRSSCSLVREETSCSG
jgi:hypothetical protein